MNVVRRSFVFVAIFGWVVFAQAALGNQSDDAHALLRAIDAERSRAGVGAVAIDERIGAVAAAYAADMARRGFFGHVSPEGDDPFTRMRRAGIRFHAAGENVGFGRDLAQAERSIYGDAAHRAIVLGPRFRRVGLGTARSRTGVIVVEDFTN